MKQNILFETKRMQARKIGEEDVPHLLALFSDPIVMQAYGRRLAQEELKDYTAHWLQNILKSYVENNAGLWAYQLKTTHEFVGQCGLLFRPNFDGRDEVEVGYMFRAVFWNQGLATEAVQGAMEYARRHLHLKRLISLIQPSNSASRKVAEKNGMKVEKSVIYKNTEHLVYVSEL